jgi:hypothetical protein
MNVEIGAEAALFPENEYISGIFVAVQSLIFERPESNPTWGTCEGVSRVLVECSLVLLESTGVHIGLPAHITVVVQPSHIHTFSTRGRFLGRHPEKSLKGFPPCYSQSPLLTDFTGVCTYSKLQRFLNLRYWSSGGET